jgi:pimeloyl-ACP methyl ester carboxylesterase
MKTDYFWTEHKSRLRLMSTKSDTFLNWLLLPGGPGLGSESLTDLSQILKPLGTVWHLDLPGDGSNTISNDDAYFSLWPQALVEAVQFLENVVLVAHSTGGMYVLSEPRLEKLIAGLVLISSAPDADWQNKFLEYIKQHPLPEVENLRGIYCNDPNNDSLKKLTIASAPYLFTATGLEKGIALLEKLPFNYRSCEWSAQHFDSTYKAKWFPKIIPTLIMTGDEDHITPLDLFAKSKHFQRENILFREISNAGHYPWIENPEQTRQVFEEYYQMLIFHEN